MIFSSRKEALEMCNLVKNSKDVDSGVTVEGWRVCVCVLLILFSLPSVLFQTGLLKTQHHIKNIDYLHAYVIISPAT